MVRKLTSLATAILVVTGLWMVGTMFGVDFAGRFKQLFLTNEAQDRLTLDESEKLCLGLEMWHGAEKGTSGKVIMRLIGVAALNYKLANRKKRNICVTFERGELMLSKAHPPESLHLFKVIAIRKVGVVTKEVLGTAKEASYAEASMIAREILAVVEAGKPPASVLPPELSEYGCAEKFIRKFGGLLAPRIPGGFNAIREDFKAERRVAKPPIDGFEFFCPPA